MRVVTVEGEAKTGEYPEQGSVSFRTVAQRGGLGGRKLRWRWRAAADLTKKCIKGTGTGSDVMSRVAAPRLGSITSPTVPTFGVLTTLYAAFNPWQLERNLRNAAAPLVDAAQLMAAAP